MPDSQFPFLSVLNEDPRLAFYSQLYGGGQPRSNPLQQNYFSGQFNDIYSQYLGTQGQGLAGAQQRGLSLADYLNQPNQTFMDYLSQTPFTQRFAQLPPEFRPGQNTNRFSPSTRWAV